MILIPTRRQFQTMRHSLLVVACAGLLAATSRGQETWSLVDDPHDGGKLEIHFQGTPFATYCYRDTEIPRPYFANVVVPGGIKVTRNHPPQAGDAQDHDKLHPGLWLAFGDLSGNDNWRLKAAVRHERFVEQPVVDASSLRFSVENVYLKNRSNEQICRELCRYEFLASNHGVLMNWDSTFESDEADFYFGDQEEMGLGVRLATPIAVTSNSGGRILNSNGQRNEQQAWGQLADWCDYSGVVGDRFVGVLLMPHPENFNKAWYHARDYGFVAANPFGRQAFTGGEKSKITVKQGDTFRLRYSIYIHWNASADEFDPARVFATPTPGLLRK